MRGVLVIAMVFGSISLAHAQEQDRKLLDRILKPDMSLQDKAQGKRFDTGGETLTRSAPTKSFTFFNRTRLKEFAGVKAYHAKAFSTRRSGLADRTANTQSRTEIAHIDKRYAVGAYATNTSPETRAQIQTSEYAGTRPFLVRGKSQKALSAQDRPLTIDEVRELLNKNN